MTTKVITGPNTRFSYLNANEPKSINGSTPKYSASLIIPKEDSELYSGIYGRASITFYAFNSNGNKGIACGLNNLQKLRDGEPLGGRTRAEDDFATEDDDDFLN
ncbi:DUF2815 family protein [Streptococcus sp. 2021WUSS030]